ncbi:TetR/AcrR family transcriptional regulator [bacterium]|nr:TetR/AcrR family transcriptional regulator [bacterium]
MQQSRRKILKTASELFSEFGFLGVSMETIAKKLNITKAALYYHFKSKKELYFEVLEKSFQNLVDSIDREISRANSPEEAFKRAIKGYLKFGQKEKNLIRCLVLKTPDQDSEITSYITKLRKRINHRLQAILKEILKKLPNSLLSKKIDLKYTTSFLLGTMNGLILESTSSNKKLNVEKIASQISQILISMLNIPKEKIKLNLKKSKGL